MLKIEGLDELQQGLDRIVKALEEIEGDFGTVSFDPEDPASIEQAISTMERMVDDKLADTHRNEFVEELVQELKDKFREQILESAAQARLEDDQ